MEDLMLQTIMLSLVIWMLECATVDGGRVLGPIYWNTSNSLFRSGTEPAIDVDIDDKLDIICPRQGRDDGEQLFFFKLYLVSADNYRKCDATGGKRLITCNVPQREKKYTFFFQEISPSPWGLEFKPGTSYYVVSTSDGTASGLDGMEGGVCTLNNMKLEMRVHEKGEHNNVDVANPISPRNPAKQPVRPPGDGSRNSGHDVKNRHETQDFQPPQVPRPTPRLPTKVSVRPDVHVQKAETNKQNGDNLRKTSDDSSSSSSSSNGMWIGIVLGACAVLFVVFLAFLGYKVYRKRRRTKKYQSPPMTPTPRGADPLSQVTLLPIGAAPPPHSHHPPPSHRLVSSPPHEQRQQHRALSSASTARHDDLRPPPSYNESFLDNGGPVVAV